MAKKINRDLILNGNLTKALLSLAIPIVANSFLQTLYNLTDTYWLGKLGEANQAAITLITPGQNIIINFGTGIVTAGSVLIAQYLGAGKDEEAKKMASHVLMCSMIFSLVMAALCFMATPTIVRFMGAESKVADYSTIYMRIIILDMPLLFLINVFTSVNQSQGNTVKPLMLNILGIVLNMILDPLFMMVFKWGITGAGLATLLAKVPCGIIALISLFNTKNNLHVSYKGFKFKKDMLASIVKIGLPTAVGSSTMQLGFLLMSRNVAKYGTVALASYGIGNKINGLISLPSNGMGSATATIVGLNIGANNYERAKSAYRLARNISVVFLFVGGLILSSAPVSKAVVGIFSDNSDVVKYASDFLSLMALWCFTNGVQNSTQGLFQGSGHTMITMAIDASRIWIFRFATLYVCESLLNMGLASIWYSVVVSNAISPLILFILYKCNIGKKRVIKIEATA